MRSFLLGLFLLCFSLHAATVTLPKYTDGGHVFTTPASASDVAGVVGSAGTLQLGTSATTLGTLSLAGNASGLVTIRPAASAGTWTFTLPTTPHNGYVLQTDGSGTTTWAAPTGVTSIATNSGLTGGPITSTGTIGIADGGIFDAKINASAAIAGTKIAPDFGTQTIMTKAGTNGAGDNALTVLNYGNNRSVQLSNSDTGDGVIHIFDGPFAAERITLDGSDGRITADGRVSAVDFDGDGSLLTNLNAGNISSGTIADARLSANVPLLNAANAFTDTMTMATGKYYSYNAVPIAYGQTALRNFYFGNSGNLTGTGEGNTAIGNGSFVANTTGHDNVALGSVALQSNQDGNNNLGIGTAALLSNVSGTNNVAIGLTAMLANTSGAYNVAVGADALHAVQASGNIGIGLNAGNGQTSGNYNTYIGFACGSNQTAGSNNLTIGSSIDVVNATGSNQLNIGNMIFGTSIDGTGGTISSGAIGIGVKAPAEVLDVAGNVKAVKFKPASTTAGKATLVAGTVTVTTAQVLTGSIIVLTPYGTGVGILNVGSITNATSFVINSSDITDTRAVSWLILDN